MSITIFFIEMEFLYPNILFALVAVAIPIAVHLFNFRKYKKIYFSNVDMLQSIHKKTKKQSELKHLLILLLRILTVIALVFAFAQAYFPNKDSLINDQEKQWVSIYVDNSFSMTQKGEESSLLEEAKSKALNILESYKTQDRFHLITNDLQAKHHRWYNKMEMEQNILQIKAVFLQQDLAQILQREKMLREEGSDDQSSQKALLYVLSDFQKTLLQSADIQEDTSLLCRFLPLQNTPINNIYIDSIWFQNQIQLPHGISKLMIRVVNNGSEDLSAIPLRLFINEEQKALVSVSLASKESKNVEMSFSNGEGGVYNGKLMIDDYPIIFDDHYYFTFLIRDKIKIANINQENTNTYLQHLFQQDSSISYQSFSIQNIPYTHLQQYDFIILNELEELGSGFQQELVQYVKRGGLILNVPCASPKGVYDLFFKELGVPFYASLDTNTTIFASINKDLAFFGQVFENTSTENNKNEKRDLPIVKKFYPLKNTNQDNSVALLQTRGGKTLLSQSSFEQGQIFQMAFPLNLSYTNLPEHALFVPVLYQMLLQATAQKSLYQVIGSSAMISVAIPQDVSNKEVVLSLQKEKNQWIPQQHRKSSYQWQIFDVQWPEDGVFELKLDDIVLKNIAVNYDRIESDFSLYSAKELREWIAQKSFKYFQIIQTQNQKIGTQIIQEDHVTKLWKWLVFFAIIFIFVETLILRLWK